MTDKIQEMIENKAPYPYWKSDFDKEMKGYEVWYRALLPGGKKTNEDMADGYRVFMIMCNNNHEMPRMDVLNMLKAATEENPIKIGSEIMWCEKR